MRKHADKAVRAPPVSDSLKDQAKALLRRIDTVGKPLAMKFTAMDGREVDLSRMKGEVVLIDFWATWCVPCVEEVPLLKDTYEKFHSRGLEIVSISSDKHEKALRDFVQEHDLPWPEYFERSGLQNKFDAEFVIESIPTLWLVDKKGNLRETDAANSLQDKVQKLLAE